MSDLADIQDLLDADDPLAWAHDNLRLVARGDAACVFDHPAFPGAVVRVSDYPDGWFGYAMALDALAASAGDGPLADAISRHAPGVLGMAYLERPDTEAYVAVCERLAPAEEGEDHEQARIAGAIMATRFAPSLDEPDPHGLSAHARDWAEAAVGSGRIDPGEARAFVEDQPLFLALAQALPPGFADLREGNWMRRGRHLVLNDPSGTMSPADEARFKRLHALPASSAAICRP